MLLESCMLYSDLCKYFCCCSCVHLFLQQLLHWTWLLMFWPDSSFGHYRHLTVQLPFFQINTEKFHRSWIEQMFLTLHLRQNKGDSHIIREPLWRKPLKSVFKPFSPPKMYGPLNSYPCLLWTGRPKCLILDWVPQMLKCQALRGSLSFWALMMLTFDSSTPSGEKPNSPTS